MKEKERKTLTTEGGVKFVLLSGNYDLGMRIHLQRMACGNLDRKRDVCS